jgi:hypothetical protein
VDSVYHLLVVDTMTVLTPTGPRRIGIISFPEEGAK